MKNKSRLFTCIAIVLAGLVIAGLIAYSRFQASDPQNTIFADYYDSIGWDRAPDVAQRACMGVSDGLMTVGICLAGVGFLVWISSTGFFDMISYGFASLKVMFTPFGNPKTHPRFYDYKTVKQENRKSGRTLILYLGLGFLAAAAVFAGLYYIV